MFDFGWTEFLIIGIVALIAIGPKELPGVLRGLGHWIGKVRRMASDFQDQFKEALREAEVADLKKQFDEATQKAAAGFDNPLETAQKEVEKAFGPDPVSDPYVPQTETPMPPTETTPGVASADPGILAPSAGSAVTPPEALPEPAAAPAPSEPAPAEPNPVPSKTTGTAA
jgi:sec-independent protein translocase protein TatB